MYVAGGMDAVSGDGQDVRADFCSCKIRTSSILGGRMPLWTQVL